MVRENIRIKVSSNLENQKTKYFFSADKLTSRIIKDRRGF